MLKPWRVNICFQNERAARILQGGIYRPCNVKSNMSVTKWTKFIFVSWQRRSHHTWMLQNEINLTLVIYLYILNSLTFPKTLMSSALTTLHTSWGQNKMITFCRHLFLKNTFIIESRRLSAISEIINTGFDMMCCTTRINHTVKCAIAPWLQPCRSGVEIFLSSFIHLLLYNSNNKSKPYQGASTKLLTDSLQFGCKHMT